MQTIRGRLTAWYAAALALTLVAFAGVLYLDRRTRSEVALTAGILAESFRARGALVRTDAAGRPALIGDLSALLEAVPDVLLITASDGSLLFASPDARALTFQQVERLRLAAVAGAAAPGAAAGTLALGPRGPKVRYAVGRVTGAGPQFGAIL